VRKKEELKKEARGFNETPSLLNPGTVEPRNPGTFLELAPEVLIRHLMMELHL
jgi:hypothetical protein